MGTELGEVGVVGLGRSVCQLLLLLADLGLGSRQLRFYIAHIGVNCALVVAAQRLGEVPHRGGGLVEQLQTGSIVVAHVFSLRSPMMLPGKRRPSRLGSARFLMGGFDNFQQHPADIFGMSEIDP